MTPPADAAADFPARLRAASASARRALLAEREPHGAWVGRLSSSALSTATAIMALWKAEGPEAAAPLLRAGLDWLTRTQTADGAWGDTPESRPNISTTLLCWAAYGMAGENGEPVRRCEAWLTAKAGGLDPAPLAAALAARYGRDRTFSVPILMACALGGRLGASPECWKLVPQLPFELAALPRQWFAALRLPVVSYALPALIAIGQVRDHHRPAPWPWSLVRRAAAPRTRRLLREIQPDGGGFLEATPLTAFVTMALADAGHAASDTLREAVAFLRRSMRADGSWPIDTDLATWGTTLSIKALADTLPADAVPALRQALLSRQYQAMHPYTLSAPGGWAWTPLPGGVPDADDTAGALLALHTLDEPAESPAALAGVRWLLGLQNRDGGMPTFCRGWGALPFDRSAPDLTAHALAAFQAWRSLPGLTPLLPAMRRAVAWLARTQRADGSWEPLWFGNEWTADEANPVHGAAVVLKYLTTLPDVDFPALPGLLRRAADFLLTTRQPSGWSGGKVEGHVSIEETALALEALASLELTRPGSVPAAALRSGAEALLALTADGTAFPPTPIGLYFARLWYHERLYPLAFSAAALRLLSRCTDLSPTATP